MSTTHTTVGAVVGMSMVLYGAGAVNWSARTNEFPFFSGIAAIVASWCVACPPALALQAALLLRLWLPSRVFGFGCVQPETVR